LVSFPYAVAKKFGDDQAGNLAALVAYYGFFSLFPLLLVLAAGLGIVLRGDPQLQRRILDSALGQFPLIGVQLRHDVAALGRAAGVPMGIGIVGTIWAGMGVVKAMQNALDTVWGVPYKDRPNAFASSFRALLMLAILGVMTVVSATLAGLGASTGGWARGIVATVLSLLLNLVLFLLSFKILTSADVSWSDVRVGALVGAVGWTTLQSLGGYFVAHQLRGASEVYGTFALVIGLLAWIYLGAQLTLLSAEINVVREARLWPRSISNDPLTEADQRTLRRLARIEERLGKERVEVTIHTTEEEGGDGPREQRVDQK